MASPVEIERAKEIMIAYIQSLGTASNSLFLKPGRESQANESFEGAWDRIIKKVSVQG